jgi:gliding motility-associated-like protein
MGCYNSDTVEIKAVACCDIFVPNAFSPNGDGLNDFFKPQMNNGQLLVYFQIFDRWGQMVYQNSSNHGIGWSGQYANGREAEADSYNFIIQYTCDGGSNQVRRGDVTLVR